MKRRIKVAWQMSVIRYRLFWARIFKYWVIFLYKVGQMLVSGGDKLSRWAFQQSEGRYWQINYIPGGRYDPVIRDRYSR